MTETYHRPGVIYRRAGPEDDDEMRAALRENSMNSWVTATLEHEPSCFAGDEPGQFVPMVARRKKFPNELVGLYSCRFAPVHVNGRNTRACYLGGLRLQEKYRGHPGILKGGFDSIPTLLPNVKETPLVFTSIAEDNFRARRVLEANLEGMPRYRFLGTMETFAVSVACGRESGLLKCAVPSDAQEIAAFYNAQTAFVALSPVLEDEWLERMIRENLLEFLIHRDGSPIDACIAVWDQRAYKQIVIKGYGRVLNLLRPFLNLWARAAKKPCLPDAGQRLEQVFLAFYAVDASAVEKEEWLVREALYHARQKGADSALLGVSPLSRRYGKLKQALKPYIYTTRIQAVEFCSPPLQIDGLVQPEVALL
jgi:hypothetical protein